MGNFGLSAEQLKQLDADFAATPIKLREKQLLSVMEHCDDEEKLCMKYLYAYMPVSDLASYNGDIFYKTACDTLEIRNLVPWGEKIDGELFLNYVLPLRFNNENLVDHRKDFFDELFPRVKNLSLKDAVLEVNYWCFEKATYQSTDIRTSSPLNVVRNAFGRCGEESVLCVAALRSVGIPARQCYTPRWAHCDDNHAWVEVWIDGKWHFIGACEPEPVLDRGWFAEPASRGMLIHARVFSRLVSEKEITNQTLTMSQVNILGNYAKTKRLTVTVTEADGKPAEGVEVRFELMNFSELFPIATIKTNEKGQADLLTGYGDMHVHVSKNGRFLTQKAIDSCEKLAFSLADAVESESGDSMLDMAPPPSGNIHDGELSTELAEYHQKKNSTAIEIRKAFENTFITGERAKEFAKQFDDYQEEISECIALANGNHPEISAFLKNDCGIELKFKVMLLKSLSKKDMSDITCEILNSHLLSAHQYKSCVNVSEEIFAKYILCPRVDFEMISSYRSFISTFFTETQKAEFVNQPTALHRYIEDNIANCGDRDYATISASPQGLLELKCGSETSKKILFVAVCRTLGIPARMSEIDKKLEYYQNGGWQTITKQVDKAIERNSVLKLKKKNIGDDWGYTKNFTIAKLENGVYVTLGLFDITFENGIATYLLEEGYYRLITSNRMQNGTNSADLVCFSLKKGEQKEIIIALREPVMSADKTVTLPEVTLRTVGGDKVGLDSVLKLGKPSVVAFLKEGGEPTEHLLNEINDDYDKFAAEHGRILFLVSGEESLKNEKLKLVIEKTNIPYLFRTEDGDVDRVLEALGSNNKILPLVLCLNSQGKCVFHMSGYNVGTGEQLIKHLDSRN